MAEEISEKFCKECKLTKEIALFYRDKRRPEFTKSGYTVYCKECHYKKVRNYISKTGREHSLIAKRKYNVSERGKKAHKRYESSEKAKLSHKKWRKSEAGRTWHNKYQKNQTSVNIQYWLARNLRSRLKNALAGNFKNGSAVENLGCSIEELKVHLENQFTDKMNWNNKGKYWHIDHKVPLRKVDLTDINELKRVCHYTNLQPLYWQDNLSKGAK